MISASDFRKGTKFVYEKEPFTVIDFQHVKPGKGGAFVRTKMKSLITGLMREATFRVEEKFSQPDIQYKDMQYLYQDGASYCFMDQETFDQVYFNKSQIEEVLDYLKEQEIYSIVYLDGKALSVNPPIFVEVKVIEAPLGVRGNTAQGAATKTIKLETGMSLQAPLFVEEGDLVKVDTRTGEYVERVKK
jgi:elongation factor P